MGMLLRPTALGHAVPWMVAQNLDQLPKAEGAGTAAKAADYRSGAATVGLGAATPGTAAATPCTLRRRPRHRGAVEGRGQEGWRVL